MIVHVATREMVAELAEEIPQSAQKLMDAFWPGPLTVVVKAKPAISKLCTAGMYVGPVCPISVFIPPLSCSFSKHMLTHTQINRMHMRTNTFITICVLLYLHYDPCRTGCSTVGIRMPNHPLALALIKQSNRPIAAPSANLSGRPSPTTAAHVINDLQGKIAGVVAGGPSFIGVESTVVDCTGGDDSSVQILRPGGLTREQLLTVIPHVTVDPAIEHKERLVSVQASLPLQPSSNGSSSSGSSSSSGRSTSVVESGDPTLKPKAPGMKYTHYAPSAPLRIVRGSPQYLQRVVQHAKSQGQRVGVMITEEMLPLFDSDSEQGQVQADQVVTCGSEKDLASVARNLYDCLRKFDEPSSTVSESSDGKLSCDTSTTVVDVIFSCAFPSHDIGNAIMNRLMKAAGFHVISESEDVL